MWLEVSPAEAARRISAGTGRPDRTRPLLAGGDPEARLSALLARRAAHYAEVAHVRVATDGRSAAEVGEAVLAALASPA